MPHTSLENDNEQQSLRLVHMAQVLYWHLKTVPIRAAHRQLHVIQVSWALPVYDEIKSEEPSATGSLRPPWNPWPPSEPQSQSHLQWHVVFWSRQLLSDQRIHNSEWTEQNTQLLPIKTVLSEEGMGIPVAYCPETLFELDLRNDDPFKIRTGTSPSLKKAKEKVSNLPLSVKVHERRKGLTLTCPHRLST